MAFEFFGALPLTREGIQSPDDKERNFASSTSIFKKAPGASMVKAMRPETLVCAIDNEWEGAGCVYKS